MGGSGKWPSMREFKVDLQPGAADTFTKEVIRTTEGWTVYNNGNENNAIDGDGRHKRTLQCKTGRSYKRVTL